MNLAIRHIKRRKAQREFRKAGEHALGVAAALTVMPIDTPDMLIFVMEQFIKNDRAIDVVKRMQEELKEAHKYEYETTELIDDLENSLDSIGTRLSLMHHYPDNKDEYEPDVTVYAYMYDRAFGGHEEGGWWYDTQTPLDRETYTMPLSEAIKWTRRANELLEMVNKNRREVSSVLSEGRYRYGWTLRSKPVAKPRHRPHYC